MHVRFKDGVTVDNAHAQVFFAIYRACAVWESFNQKELWITGGREHGHTTNPDPNRQFHWLPDSTCQAIDLRVHMWKSVVQEEARDLLAKSLGPDFDVILEFKGTDKAHIHVQFDPSM